MKKLLITLIMAFAIVFSLAMIASASTTSTKSSATFSTDFGKVTYVDNMSEKSLLDTTSRVVLAENLIQNDDGTYTCTGYTTYPSYYIVKNATNFDVDFTDLNKSTGKSYGPESIILMEVPNGITSIYAGRFGRNNGNQSNTIINVEKVILPETMTTVPAQSFRACQSLKSITLSKSITSLPSWAFNDSKELVEIIIPKGSKLETIGSPFSGCVKLEYIGFENATELTTITSSKIFGGCKSLKVLNLGNTKIVDVQKEAFKDDVAVDGYASKGTYIELFIFPETYTNMDTYPIDACANPITIVFLGKMTYVDTRFVNTPITFYFAKNSLADINGNYVESGVYGENKALGYVMEQNVYTSKTDGTCDLRFTKYNNNNSDTTFANDEQGRRLAYVNETACKMYFCGEDKMAFFVRNSVNYGKYTEATDFSGSGAGFIAVFDIDNDYHKTKGSDEYLLTHHLKHDFSSEVTEATCTETEKTTYYCVACGEFISTDETAPALGHILEGGVLKGVTYPNGFAKEGFKKIECIICREIDETTIANAIFKANGYSIAEFQDANGNFVVVGGYTIISLEDYDLYEQFNGPLKYGIIFVNANGLNNIDFKNGVIDLKENSEGKATIKAIQVEVQNEKEDSENDKETRFTTFNFKVSGFVVGNDTHENLKLLISMYVIEKDNVMSFIQSSSEIYESETVSVDGNEEIALNVFTFGALNSAASKD